MTENDQPKIGALLLAAGGSSRLGRPKQLLQFDGKTLIRRAAESLINSKCGAIVVVLGAETERSSAELSGLPLHISVNKDWQNGMSSSIKTGLNALLGIEPDLEAVVITLCDQPHVTSNDIDRIIAAFRDQAAPIAAAKYGEVIGVPALFSRELFDDLFKLRGDKGARSLILNTPDVTTVPFEKAACDIDTPDDVMSFAKNESYGRV